MSKSMSKRKKGAGDLEKAMVMTGGTEILLLLLLLLLLYPP